MNVAPLQSGYLLSSPADHQLFCAESHPPVCVTFTAGQSAAGLPGKTIDQRSCVVNPCAESGESDIEYFEAHEFAGSPTSSNDEYFEAPDRLDQQQMPEPQQSDGDGPWQVVRGRRSGRKRQQSSAVTPSDARRKNGARAKSASAGQWPENCSPMRQQKIRLEMSGALSQYRRLCIKSFERLGAEDLASFDACQTKDRFCLQTNITRDDCQRFHRLMTKGPHAIWRVDDVVFLAGPFKVLMSRNAMSFDAILLSLVFDRAVPGFLTMLGDCFVKSLTGVNPKNSKLCKAITELLIQMCHEDEDWLNRLGWQKLSVRGRCNLFWILAILFKQSSEKDLIRNLQQQVSGLWLEEQYNATVQRISCDTEHKDPKGDLYDLRANVRAVFSLLEAQVFYVGKTQERSGLIVRYADICDALFKAMDSLAPLLPETSLLRLWRPVAEWSVRFRTYLSHCLGLDRSISLLDKLLKKIEYWRDLDPLAFELRLSLLRFVLTKCEELTHKRDTGLFSQAWSEYEKKLESLLAECNRFMADYKPPFAADEESDYDRRREEEVRLELKLRESVFNRLNCESCRSTRQCIQENLQECRRAFEDRWALSQTYREVGSIELAKWYFLAGEHDAGVSTLTSACYKNVKLSWKKADILARHGVYHAAVDEYHHIKTLMSESGETDRRKRDKVDNRVAMTQLQWYLVEDGTDHLIEAYRLSVGLLGRCDVRDREDFEGVLLHIVNTIKRSGLRFEDFARQTSVLGYLVKEGNRIKSWHHFANLLHVRHKEGLTSVDSVNKTADEMGVKHGYFPGLDKMS